MGELDLFGNWDPDLLRCLIASDTERSRATRNYWNSLSDEERTRRIELNRINSKRGSDRIREILSDSRERALWVSRSFDSLEGNENSRSTRANWPEDKRKEIYGRRAETLRKTWKSYSKEEVMRRMRNSCLSPEARKKNIEATHMRPTDPEKRVWSYLERAFPGEYIYSGDGQQYGVLRSKGYKGLKIPDFISTNGRREVISVMGGLGFTHFWADEEEEISYYARHGFKCLVIWEWDTWDKEELGGLLRNFRR